MENLECYIVTALGILPETARFLFNVLLGLAVFLLANSAGENVGETLYYLLK